MRHLTRLRRAPGAQDLDFDLPVPRPYSYTMYWCPVKNFAKAWAAELHLENHKKGASFPHLKTGAAPMSVCPGK